MLRCSGAPVLRFESRGASAFRRFQLEALFVWKEGSKRLSTLKVISFPSSFLLLIGTNVSFNEIVTRLLSFVKDWVIILTDFVDAIVHFHEAQFC